MTRSTAIRRVFSPFRSSLPLALAAVLLLGTAVKAQQRLPLDRLKSGAQVRKAFQKLIAEARKATVAVLSKNKQIALGAIVDSAGYVLTKASELKGSIECRLWDGRKLPAQIIGVHDQYDIAMLRVDAEQLQSLQLHTGKDPGVGKWLVTVGTGESPVSVGVVSVHRRAIPKPRAVLGVSLEDDKLGVRITRIFPNSGAAKAGLKVGDIITWIAGKVVKKRRVLADTIGKLQPGDTLAIRVRRKDSSQDVTLRATLGTPDANTRSRSYVQNRMGGQLSKRRSGFPFVLQHDTVLRPEDCGGPVLDLTGHFVGLNIARAGRVESYSIPAEKIVGLLYDLKSGKLAPRHLGPPPPPLPEG